MSIRSQDLDTNALLLYPLCKGASSPEAAPVFSLPEYDEDSDGGQGSALRDGEEEGTDLKLTQQVDVKGNLSNESVEIDVKVSSGTSAEPIDPTVLPAGYGAAIIASFLAMIKYLNEMAEQGYQMTTYSANAMIGTEGKKGLIQSWVDAGMSSATAQGSQITAEAIGSLVSGAVCGLSVLGSLGGFVKNSTSSTTEVFGGRLQNENGRINLELANAQSYRKTLNEPSTAENVAQAETDKVVENKAAANQQAVENAQAEQQQQTTEKKVVEKKEVELDKDAKALKERMTKEAIKTYKSKKDENGVTLSQEAQAKRDTDIETAAQHLGAEERIAAKEKADKWIESLQNQLGQCESAQNQWVSGYMSPIGQVGQAGGQAWGGFTKQESAVEAQKQKANSDTLSQTSQTTEDVKQKATQQAQSDRDQMGQTAQAMAQALASQTQSRA